MGGGYVSSCQNCGNEAYNVNHCPRPKDNDNIAQDCKKWLGSHKQAFGGGYKRKHWGKKGNKQGGNQFKLGNTKLVEKTYH